MKRRAATLALAISWGYLLGHWHGRDWAGGLAIVVIVATVVADVIGTFTTHDWPPPGGEERR